jgi:hypothetical protein
MGVPLMASPWRGWEHASLVARYLRDVLSWGNTCTYSRRRALFKAISERSGPKDLRERLVRVTAMKNVRGPFE